MHTDGQLLRDFIDNQKVSKKEIARGLGITRTTLYQYFDSTELADETKRKMETYFKQKIFPTDKELGYTGYAPTVKIEPKIETQLKEISTHLENIEESQVASLTKILEGQKQILSLLTQRNGHSKEALSGEKPLRKGNQK